MVKKMARTFSSIDEVSKFIKTRCYSQILDEVADETESVMKEVTEDQVQGSTGDMINCIGETERSNDSVTVAWQDNGNWFSLSEKTYGDHMYAPFALENGYTFEIGKPMFSGFYHEKTTLEETSKKIMADKSVEIARRILNKNGFKV